jgi:hypothetical protein
MKLLRSPVLSRVVCTGRTMKHAVFRKRVVQGAFERGGGPPEPRSLSSAANH